MILPDDQLKAVLEKSGAVPHDVLEAVSHATGGEYGSLDKQLISKHILTEEQLGQILLSSSPAPHAQKQSGCLRPGGIGSQGCNGRSS